MLDVKISVFDHDRESIPQRYLDGCTCTVGDAVTAVGHAYSLRELASRRGGASGHKAWVAVQANDIELMLYFMGPTVVFELSRKDVPDDEAYCNGELPYDGIPELLTLVDAGNDPIVYLENVSLTINCSPRD